MPFPLQTFSILSFSHGRCRQLFYYTIDKLSVDKITVDKMSVDKMSVDKKTLDD